MDTSTILRASWLVASACVVLHASGGTASAQYGGCAGSYEDCYGDSDSGGWGGDYDWDLGRDIHIGTEVAVAMAAVPLGVVTTVLTVAQLVSRNANDGVARNGWVIAGTIVGIVDILFGAGAGLYGLVEEHVGIGAMGLGVLALGGVSLGLAVSNPSPEVRADARPRADGMSLVLSGDF